MKTAHRAGQATGIALVLATVLLVGRWITAEDPPPVLTPGEIILDAYDRSAAACVSQDEIMRVMTSNPMRWSENPPLTCTDAPPDTRWITVTVEDRTRFYAFGPDGCRIPVAEASCP
jgi:hypothetical protein